MFRTELLWSARVCMAKQPTDIKLCQSCTFSSASGGIQALVLIDFDSRLYIVFPDFNLDSPETRHNWTSLVFRPIWSLPLEQTIRFQVWQKLNSEIHIMILHPFAVTSIVVDHRLTERNLTVLTNLTDALPSAARDFTVFDGGGTKPSVLISSDSRVLLTFSANGDKAKNRLSGGCDITCQMAVASEGIVLFQRASGEVEGYRTESFEQSNSFRLKPVWSCKFYERLVEIKEIGPFQICHSAEKISARGTSNGVSRFEIQLDCQSVASEFFMQGGHVISVVCDDKSVVRVFQNQLLKWSCQLYTFPRFIGRIFTMGFEGVLTIIDHESAISAVILTSSLIPELETLIRQKANAPPTKISRSRIDITLKLEKCSQTSFQVSGVLEIQSNVLGEIQVIVSPKGPVRVEPATFIIQVTEEVHQIPISFRALEIPHRLPHDVLRVRILARRNVNSRHEVFEKLEYLPIEAIAKIGNAAFVHKMIDFVELESDTPLELFEDQPILDNFVVNFFDESSALFTVSDSTLKISASSFKVIPFLICELASQLISKATVRLLDPYVKAVEEAIKHLQEVTKAKDGLKGEIQDLFEFYCTVQKKLVAEGTKSDSLLRNSIDKELRKENEWYSLKREEFKRITMEMRDVLSLLSALEKSELSPSKTIELLRKSLIIVDISDV